MRIQRLKDGVLWIAAANDQEVKQVIVSAGLWSKAFYEVPRESYPCDPAKNTKCTKTGCYYVTGGPCFQTLDREFRRDTTYGET